MLSKDNIELQFATNHIGIFFLFTYPNVIKKKKGQTWGQYTHFNGYCIALGGVTHLLIREKNH